MNVRIVSGGTVYTAESEGFVKEFSPKGEFVKLVAHATVTGGCKNVAVAATPDGKTVYFCDQPGSQIIILTLKTTAKIGRSSLRKAPLLEDANHEGLCSNPQGSTCPRPVLGRSDCRRWNGSGRRKVCFDNGRHGPPGFTPVVPMRQRLCPA